MKTANECVAISHRSLLTVKCSYRRFTIYSLSPQHIHIIIVGFFCQAEGHLQERPRPAHHLGLSFSRAQPRSVEPSALDGLAENIVSGIYWRGLSSRQEIVWDVSLIRTILSQCNCLSPPCKHDHKLLGPLLFHFFFLIPDFPPTKAKHAG